MKHTLPSVNNMHSHSTWNGGIPWSTSYQHVAYCGNDSLAKGYNQTSKLTLFLSTNKHNLILCIKPQQVDIKSLNYETEFRMY